MTSIALVCGAFHRTEVQQMIEHATEEAKTHNLKIAEIVWIGIDGSTLATARLLEDKDIAGVACLGIIEGETQHGIAMGQAVIKSFIDLQLGYTNPSV